MTASTEPHISCLGPVAIWWIPKPRGPRVSVRNTGLGWLAALTITAMTLIWIQAQGDPLWPFGPNITSPGQMTLRYEIILLVYLAYVTCRSLRGWLHYRRQAKQDARAIDDAISQERWEHAALLVHRYCLCVFALWRRLPGRVAAWDGILRKKLSRHRRLYLYYVKDAPPLPQDAASSFVPEIIPPNQPSKISLIGMIPIGLLLYLLLLEVRRIGQWELALTFNVVLLTTILLSYGSYFGLALLGRSHHYRFVPGTAQGFRYGIWRRRPRVDTYDLRSCDVSLDLSAPWVTLQRVNPTSAIRSAIRFPNVPAYLEAALRSVLSTAPRPPLSHEGLLE